MWWCRTLLLSFLANSFLFSGTYAETSSPELFNQLPDNKNRPFKICVLEKRNSVYNNVKQKCSTLEKQNAPVRCVMADDRLDCLRKVSLQKADFAVFEPEELLVASSHPNLENILIVSEFQFSYSTFNKVLYSLTAVVRNDVNINSLQDLEGKRVCHPGTDPEGLDHSDIFSRFFEDRMFVQKCDPNRTVAENRVKSLADYFGPSCRAGKWALDPILDNALKRKYYSLCENCETPQTCATHDQYWGHQNSLLCLSDCMGDITWGRVDEIKDHFKPSSFGTLRLCSNVSFMCPDGTKQDLSTPNPCVWIQKPNTVVAAHSSVAESVQNFIEKVLVSQTEGYKYRNILSTLLEYPPKFGHVDLITPSNYLKEAEGFLSSLSVTSCGKDREIKLCATSKYEKAQCEWLSAAASSYGIEPPVSCYEPADGNCFSAVQNSFADVFLTNSDQLLPAIRDYKLEPLLYETVADPSKCKYFSVLVDTYSNINKLEDLRGKNACFAAVDGVGWTTFVMELKKASLLPNVCPYTAAVSNFFNQICITSSVNSSITDNYKNIRYCNSELAEDYYKQSGIEREVVDCILNGGGHVAVVAIDSVSRYADLTGFLSQKSVKNLIGTRYKWMCGHSGLQDNPCLLTKTTMGQVLVRQKIPYIRKEDIISTFKDLDFLFGGVHKKGKQSFAFDFLTEFESSSDVLFQDLGNKLELTDIYLEKHKFENSSYENEIQNLVICQTKSAALIIFPDWQKILQVSILLLLFNKWNFLLNC